MRATATVLARVEDQRFAKAVEGFVNGAYRVTITVQDGYRVGGTVSNGDGKSYAVTLGSEDFVACSCPDAMYRKGICKHAVVLALHVIRTPQAEAEEEARPANLKLARVRPDFVSCP